MQAHLTSCHMRPTVALADYDFLRATYDMLLRAPVPDWRAINAAHARLKAAHLQQAVGLQHLDLSAGDPSFAEDPLPAH